MNVAENKEKSKGFKRFAHFSFWWGAIFTSAGLINFISGNASLSPDDGGFLLISVAPLVVGYYMIRKYKAADKKKEQLKQEMRVLKAIANHNGRITVATLSMETGMSIDESRLALEQLAGRLAISADVDDNGTIIYICNDLSA